MIYVHSQVYSLHSESYLKMLKCFRVDRLKFTLIIWNCEVMEKFHLFSITQIAELFNLIVFFSTATSYLNQYWHFTAPSLFLKTIFNTINLLCWPFLCQKLFSPLLFSSITSLTIIPFLDISQFWLRRIWLLSLLEGKQ